MSQKKGRFSLLLNLLLMLHLLGCVKKQDPHERQTLTIGLNYEIKSLVPYKSSDQNSQRLLSLVGESLFKKNESGDLVGELAEKFERPHPLQLLISLKKNIYFSDGSPLTSDDVKKSLEAYVHSGPSFRSSVSLIQKIETLGPHQLKIYLSQARYSFLNVDLSLLRVYKKIADDKWIGTGPFELIEKSDRVIRFKQSAFSRINSPYKNLVFKIIEDPQTQIFSIQKGEVDILLGQFSDEILKSLDHDSRVNVLPFTSNDFQYLALNFKNRKEFQNLKVRQALALSIPTEEIIRHKFNMKAHPATSLLPPMNQMRNNNLIPLSQDLSKAKKLLEESGLKQLKFTLLSSTDKKFNSIQLAMIEEWKKVGIEVKLLPLEWPSFYERAQKGDFEALTLSWVNIKDPEVYYRVFHSKEIPPGRNRVFYKNDKLDELLEKAEAEWNPTKRAAIYHDIQSIAFNELALIPLWYPQHFVLARRNVQRLTLSELSSWKSILESYKGPSL